MCRRHRSKDKLINYATVKDVPIKAYVEGYVLNTYDVSTAFGSGFKETTAPMNLPQLSTTGAFVTVIMTITVRMIAKFMSVQVDSYPISKQLLLHWHKKMFRTSRPEALKACALPEE